MKVYFNLFKLKFINMIQYRASAFAGIMAQIFFGLVFIMVYLAFYQSNNISNIPMKWQELVSYVWLNQAFYALTYIWVRDSNLISMIKQGNVAYEFCRPINFYKKWYATMYGSRIAAVVLKSSPLFIFAFLLPSPYQLGLPVSVNAFLLFLVAMIISSLLVTALAMIYHLIVFYTLDDRGLLPFLIVTGEIFSGGLVPLAFLPTFLFNISNFLPFRFLVDLPFRIYTGNISINNASFDILIGFIWLILIILIGFALSKKAMRQATIQGG